MGGAARLIQLINAVAAAVAGLSSPAATHSMKKLRVWVKTALFISLSVFLEQPSLFSHVHARLNLFSSKGGQ